MFGMIKGMISFVFTIIVIGVILYVFKFTIKDNAFCISFRHKEHQTQLENATENLKTTINKEKKKLGKQIVNSIMDTADETTDNAKKNIKKTKDDDEITIEQIIKEKH